MGWSVALAETNCKAQRSRGVAVSAMVRIGRRSTLPTMLKIRFDAVRRRRGWTQEELAQHLGVDRSTVGRIEAGLSGFNSKTVAKYAERLGVADHELLGYSVPPTADLDEAQERLVVLAGQLDPEDAAALVAAAEKLLHRPRSA